MIDSRLNKEISKEIENFNRAKNRQMILSVSVLLIILIISSGIYLLKPAITGFTIIEKQFNYSDNLNLEFNESDVFEWIPEHKGMLKSLKLEGSYKAEGNVKVYLEDEDIRYLIFNSEKLNESGISSITGLVVLNDSIDVNESILNNSENESTIINEAYINEIEANETEIINETINKTITIDLEYKKDSIYDADNDGVEDIYNVIDLSVENSLFNWDVNKDKLCTRWEVFNIEKQESTTVCYGNKDCCAFVDLLPSKEKWNDVLYLTYGLYGSSFNNKISAQVLYVDYNLSLENPYSNIYYSDWEELPAKFYDLFAKFDNICTETCILSLNKTSYKLIVEINNSILKLNKINYIIAEEKENNAPVLLKNFSDIVIGKNKDYAIDLSEYFYDADNDVLSYDYYKTENITIIIENDIATIIPDKDFIGIRYIFFKANDSLTSAVSNVFSINIIEAEEKDLIQEKAEINKPVKWLRKFKNDDLTLGNVSVDLPMQSFNISINKIINNEKINIEKNKIKIKYKDLVKDLDAYELEKEQEKEAKELEKEKITAEENTTLIINDINDYYEISYETEPPTAVEEEISSYNKIITISSLLSYENVLAYTSINDAPQSAIKLYWIKNNTKELFENVTYYDLNNNNLIDKIEWVVSHLSNQTFEVSIRILNVQSYPTVGGNWTVRFETSGTGNLTIMASNGTSYAEMPDNSSIIDDLQYLETRCDDVVLNTTIVCSDNEKMPYEAYKIKKRLEEIDKRLEELR